MATQGALRAANVLLGNKAAIETGEGVKSLTGIAEIIDREMDDEREYYVTGYDEEDRIKRTEKLYTRISALKMVSWFLGAFQLKRAVIEERKCDGTVADISTFYRAPGLVPRG